MEIDTIKGPNLSLSQISGRCEFIYRFKFAHATQSIALVSMLVASLDSSSSCSLSDAEAPIKW